MKIILKDKTELPVIMVNDTRPYCKGATRLGLEFVFNPKIVPYEKVNTVMRNETKTAEITIVDDSGEQFLHTDYCIDAGISEKDVVVTPSTPDKTEVTERRISITLGQYTYLEKQLKNQGIKI